LQGLHQHRAQQRTMPTAPLVKHATRNLAEPGAAQSAHQIEARQGAERQQRTIAGRER